jgi:hypothetical protein
LVATLLAIWFKISTALTEIVVGTDLATVIKVSQAVSGEMVLEKLIDSLMRAAIEQAGADLPPLFAHGIIRHFPTERPPDF